MDTSDLFYVSSGYQYYRPEGLGIKKREDNSHVALSDLFAPT
jgi:hypothetical protein